MKLCVPIRYKPEGGLYSFVAGLLEFLDRNKIAYTQAIDDDYDALFVNSWIVPYAKVAKLKRERPRLTVAQRVDGAAQDYGRGAESDREQARVNLLADVTIFQSEYARFTKLLDQLAERLLRRRLRMFPRRRADIGKARRERRLRAGGRQ